MPSSLSDLTITSDEFSDSDTTGTSCGNLGGSGSDDDDSGASMVDAALLGEIRTSRDQVDWNAAISTGIRVGSRTLQYAGLTSYSTPVVVGAATLGATALKAHDSISGYGPSIDPEELLDRGIKGADFGKNFDIDGLDEGQFGVGVGASRYIAERVTPEDYKHWVLHTNPETIMKGASWGSKFSKQASVPLTPKSGALAGACAGLIYSYTPEDSPLREIDPEQLLEGTNYSQLLE